MCNLPPPSRQEIYAQLHLAHNAHKRSGGNGTYNSPSMSIRTTGVKAAAYHVIGIPKQEKTTLIKLRSFIISIFTLGHETFISNIIRIKNNYSDGLALIDH